MNERIKLGLLLVFVAVWVALGINPLYRQDWLLENALVLLALPILVAGYLLPLAAVAAPSIIVLMVARNIWGQNIWGQSKNSRCLVETDL